MFANEFEEHNKEHFINHRRQFLLFKENTFI